MQKDMHLTNLTIPFDQGLVLPKNVLPTLTCFTTLGSATVLTASTAALLVGISVWGVGIPPGASIENINDGGSFNLNMAVTISPPQPPGVVLTFGLPSVSNPSFIPPKNGNSIIPVNSAATFEVNDLTVKGNFLPAQDTSVAPAAFVASSGTPVNSGSTFDGYTLGQIVAILKVHGIVQ
jgi:hypothetical protein